MTNDPDRPPETSPPPPGRVAGRAAAASVRDEAWFEALFRSHHRAVLAYAVRRVPDDAEDVLAEVFAAAWRHRRTVPDPALPWLYRTAAHDVLHRRRSAARRHRLATRLTHLGDHQLAGADQAELVADRLDDEARVAAVLAALPPRDAEVLRLSAWEDLDVASIAYVLSISAAAARVRLHRARRRAEQLLTTTEPAAPEPTGPVRPLVPEESR